MTLTAPSTQIPTDAELLASFKALTAAQKWVISHGHDTYVNRRVCFWLKSPATPADAQCLIAEGYLQEVGPKQYRLTDRGLALYRAWLHQPPASPTKTSGFNGTHYSRNRNLRDLWEQKLPGNGLPALTKSETAAAPTLTDEPVCEPAEQTEQAHPPVPPTSPQPPTPTPAIVQLDLTAFIQPLLAKIETLEVQLATVAKPTLPRPVVRRKSRAAMPMQIVSRRGGAA